MVFLGRCVWPIWQSALRFSEAQKKVRSYQELDDGSDRRLSKQEIEEQKKRQSRHRDVLNFSAAFVQELLALGVGGGAGGRS